MDPLRLAIAAVPLGAYLLMIGLVNLRSKPMVVTGAGDLASLGVALSGLALVGPVSLFRPEAATFQLGNAIWGFLLVLYWLWLALAVMLCRPRLVVYNATPGEVRPALAEAVSQLDPQARWAGESLALPTLGVNLHLDCLPYFRNTSLIASGGEQDLAGWRRLARALNRSLRGIHITPNPRAGLLIGVGAALLIISTWGLVSDPPAVVAAWNEFFAFG